MKVFISYSTEDGVDESTLLADSINKAFPVWEVFRCRPNSITTNNFRTAIDDEITTSDSMLWVVTERGYQSEECMGEIERAKEKNLFIISCIFSEDLVNDNRYGHNLFQRVDFTVDVEQATIELVHKLSAFRLERRQKAFASTLKDFDFQNGIQTPVLDFSNSSSRQNEHLEILNSREQDLKQLRSNSLTSLHVKAKRADSQADFPQKPQEADSPTGFKGLFEKISLRTFTCIVSFLLVVYLTPKLYWYAIQRQETIEFIEHESLNYKLNDRVELETVKSLPQDSRVATSGLPPGLAVDESGVVRGKLAKAGQFLTQVKVSNTKSSFKKQLSWEVGKHAPQIKNLSGFKEQYAQGENVSIEWEIHDRDPDDNFVMTVNKKIYQEPFQIQIQLIESLELDFHVVDKFGFESSENRSLKVQSVVDNLIGNHFKVVKSKDWLPGDSFLPSQPLLKLRGDPVKKRDKEYYDFEITFGEHEGETFHGFKRVVDPYRSSFQIVSTNRHNEVFEISVVNTNGSKPLFRLVHVGGNYFEGNCRFKPSNYNRKSLGAKK